METIGNRIKGARRAQGLSQKQAANRIGVSLAAYRMWETGGSQPAKQWYPSLAAFMGITFEDILGVVGLLTQEQVALLKASGGNLPPSGGRPRKASGGKDRRSNVKGKNLSFDLITVPNGQAA